MTELTPCWAKLVRARTLMAELATLQSDRNAEGAYSYQKIDNHDDENDPYVKIQWRVKIHEPYPMDASWILGDVIHNLRSSLDNALFHLVTEINGHQPTDKEARRIQYPIDDSADSFEPHKKELDKWLTSGQIAMILSTQPFKLGDKDADSFRALAILRDFSNTDKHRQLIVADRAHLRTNFEYEDGILDDLTVREHEARLEDGAAVLTVKFKRTTHSQDILLKPTFEQTEFIFHPVHGALPMAISLELIYDDVFDAVWELTKDHMTDHDHYIAMKYIEGFDARFEGVRRTFEP